MSDDVDDRTESPTEHRRREARRQGQVARSNDLNAAVLLLAVAAALWLLGGPVIDALAKLLHESLAEPAWRQIDAEIVSHRLRGIGGSLTVVLLSVVLLLTAAALLANLVQVGFLATAHTLQPRLDRLSPMGGLGRILSLRSVVKLAAHLAKLSVLAALAWWFIGDRLPSCLALGELPWTTVAAASANEPFRERTVPSLLLSAVLDLSARLAFWLALALMLLALLDYLFQRWKHEQDLQMTREEVRLEQKQMDGDPDLRARRRGSHRKLTQLPPARERSSGRDSWSH